MLIISLLAVPANLGNTLRCFLKIFLNNGMIQVHLLPCVLIQINKRLTCVTILSRSFTVLTINRISKPKVVYCYPNTVKIPISVWVNRKTSNVKWAPESCEEALIWKIWCYLRVLITWKLFGVTWCCLVFYFIFKKSNMKATFLLHKPACKKWLYFLIFEKL